jgi:hypothetical protein
MPRLVVCHLSVPSLVVDFMHLYGGFGYVRQCAALPFWASFDIGDIDENGSFEFHQLD